MSFHEEHIVPPRTQDGFILESKKERDKFGPHVSHSLLFSYINHRSHSHFTKKKTSITRIRRIESFVAKFLEGPGFHFFEVRRDSGF